MPQVKMLSRNEGTKLRYSINNLNLLPVMTSKLFFRIADALRSGKSRTMKNAGKKGSVNTVETTVQISMIK